MKKEYSFLSRPLLVVFVLLNALVLAFQRKLENKNVKIDVVIIANLLLFAVSMLNIWFQLKSLRNPNASSGAVIRGLMAATFLKLFVLAAAAMIYLVAAGESRNTNAIFVAMGLYIIYTWMEVRISLRLNPKK
ncbi:MAG: hypothetical protein ABI581_05765 [Sediminibacterium sp.]